MSEEEIIEQVKWFLKFREKESELEMYSLKDTFTALEELLNKYNNLKAIEQEHQKINGELREEIKQLKEEYNIKILDNAGIYQLGFKDGELNIKNKINNEYSKYQECFFEIPDENKIYLEDIMEKIIKNK